MDQRETERQSQDEVRHELDAKHLDTWADDGGFIPTEDEVN